MPCSILIAVGNGKNTLGVIMSNELQRDESDLTVVDFWV